MLDTVQRTLRETDAVIARAYLSVFRERDALMTFLFHSIFLDDSEIEQRLIHPLQRTTLAQFRRFIEYYLHNEYRFISPEDLLRGLPANGRYAMITFDDGYFNNTRVLPVLEEFKIPALFFIATDNVEQNKSFWWDAHYRERSAQGASHQAISREGRTLKVLPTEQIEVEMLLRFGRGTLQPRGDLDRPFAVGELRDFARSPYVHLGNHTANHAILTNYPAEQVRDQIDRAQRSLERVTGRAPSMIAYPNGNFSAEVARIASAAGLRAGFTVQAEKTPLPLPFGDGRLMTLGRFSPDGEDLMERQCRNYRSDLQVYDRFRRTYTRFRHGHSAAL